ncbi:helix-turn-helix domain-containing protein [Actinomadura decatromicini]|uniref:Helix-turn-helix domain-containing protein n=1 Tax=Actinomadura decatromicini TaxID=2604572 RepID=A0A5D3FSF9_9ACTN|nr:helix-turn-helix transcriptional regulator [Actinomadura decatromicini]TYK50952.1 helix-turn-helix domain-containing protein [Actinomadura decatromicini]
MSRADALRPDFSLWHLIAVELRRQRQIRKISGAALAIMLDCDRSTVARYESGDVQLPIARARILDREWGLLGFFENLVKHAKNAQDLDWWETFKEYERRANLVKTYEPSLIPGLLQRENYARAVFEIGRRTDVDEAVAERLARQEILTRKDPCKLMAILDTAAVLRAFGDADVMRDQLGYLLEISERPNVFLRVTSDRLVGYDCIGGGFTVLQTPTGDLGFATYGSTGHISLDPLDVQDQAIRYDQIGMSSLTVEATRAFLRKTLESIS